MGQNQMRVSHQFCYVDKKAAPKAPHANRMPFEIFPPLSGKSDVSGKSPFDCFSRADFCETDRWLSVVARVCSPFGTATDGLV